MTPTYEVRAWREHGWWLARVVTANAGADPAPLDSLIHARTLTKLEPTVRDLVATILDTDEDAFNIEFEYVLPAELDTLVFESIAAWTWWDAARELWRDQSTVAIRALTANGFSRREIEKLLGLSGSPDLMADVDGRYVT